MCILFTFFVVKSYPLVLMRILRYSTAMVHLLINLWKTCGKPVEKYPHSLPFPLKLQTCQHGMNKLSPSYPQLLRIDTEHHNALPANALHYTCVSIAYPVIHRSSKAYYYDLLNSTIKGTTRAHAKVHNQEPPTEREETRWLKSDLAL